MNNFQKIDNLQQQVRVLLDKGDDFSFYKALDINKKISGLMRKEYELKKIVKTI